MARDVKTTIRLAATFAKSQRAHSLRCLARFRLSDHKRIKYTSTAYKEKG